MSEVEAPGADPGPAAVFAALGDRTRLVLLSRLHDGRARSIAGLSSGTALTRQAITKHLSVLERAGLVRRARIGRETRFALRPQPIADARIYLERISERWDAALERLRSLVEE